MSLNSNSGALRETVAEIEKRLGCNFPEEYIQFLMASNGSEGFIGDTYVIFWKVEELPIYNAAYEVERCWPGLLIFATDGGGDAFAFNTTTEDWRIVRVPFIGMDRNVAMDLGGSFKQFLLNLEKGIDGYRRVGG